jgi:ribosomal protein S12 methylthiotransferase accessory factor YcaO
MPRQRQPSGRLRPWDVLLLTGAIAVLVGGGYIWELARRGQATAEDAEAAVLDALNEAVQEEIGSVAEARAGASPC